MKLNLDILYYQLSNITKIEYFPGVRKNVTVKSPIFFEKSKYLSGHLVVITPEYLPEISDSVKDVIFLCVGVPQEMPANFVHDLFVMTKPAPMEQVFNALQQIFDLFEEWDEHLKDALYENLGFGEIVESCKYVTPSPISIIDENFCYAAYSKDASKKMGLTAAFVDDYNHIPLNVVNIIISHPDYESDLKIKDVFYISRDANIIAKNVFHNDSYVGRISTPMEKNDLSNKYNASILLHLNSYVERMYAKYNGFNPKNPKLDRMHSLLPEMLEGEKESLDELELELKKLNWLPDHIYVLVCFEPGHNYSKEIYADYFCPQIEKMWKGTCAFPYGSRIVVLVNLTIFSEFSESPFNQALSVFLRESLTIAGISRNFKYYKNIYASYEQTLIALEYGSLKDPTIWAFYYNHYALDYLVEHGSKNHRVESVCHTSVLILRDYDQQTGSELYKTLYAFFDAGFNSSHAAKKLNIHRSTFLNRMEKIEQMTGIHLENWELKLHIMLSFQILG
ncbi:PucR family transcriptional regulator [Parasporobacterium paucivorans]|uniref:PucR C-terminal helix-turn-helix domain-containing protein n=1 Tax=Parasporobacterium paucivorans DSM 15970 TaxID=1122934 RepID=A0A1M6HW66_9FIRM|nr:helix-turn-helix domain-containing protein [Parasporobacterium paucivorans]SHJ26388.1 PucR C-terminal helix-turn-helix domain-containing protein [Parasporobacterium paucivorans DSM 15970]